MTQLIHDCRVRLEGLIHEGHALRVRLQSDGASPVTVMRSWQQACGTTVNELSGGSRAHWLARAFSEAFLVRSSGGEVVEEAPLTEIVGRILDVLEKAHESLAQIAEDTTAPTPSPRRFDFVHNPTLRPVVEQAYLDGRAALEDGRFADSLLTTCGVLEAILTDALEAMGHSPHDWPFQMRIEAAEQAGLIRSGCARLPQIARQYRELTDVDGRLQNGATVTARDANAVSQVLHVVMRDLNPGR